MKAILITVLLSPLAALADPGSTELANRPATTVPSHELLAKNQAETKRASGKSRGVIPVELGTIPKQDPALRKGIMERSSVLCLGNTWTIVPKGAVLFVPDLYAARVEGKPKGNLVPWKEFYDRNRAWLHAHSVDVPQARGEAEAMTTEQAESYRKIGRVVVAVCHGGPISVLPHEPKETTEGEADGKPKSAD